MQHGANGQQRLDRQVAPAGCSSRLLHAVEHAQPDPLQLDQARQQPGESLSCPPFVRGKVARPMVQKVAGSGVYFRVSILCEREGQIHIYYPPFETEPEHREWVFRTSDRIHRASSGKWSYVGKGGWRFNVSSKGRKKRRTNKGAVACDGHESAAERAAPAGGGRCDVNNALAHSNEPSMSESSQATNSCGSKTGSTSAVALWFDSHIRARRSRATQDGDKFVVLGPAMSLSVRSQLGSSVDLQPNASTSGGEDATSARHSDTTPRSTADGARPEVKAQNSTVQSQEAAQAERASHAVLAALKVRVEEGLAAEGGLGSSKRPRLDLDSSPGGDDSRRSSSTLEGSGVDSSRADARACHEL